MTPTADPHPAAELLRPYLDAMLAENQHINLTAIRDPEQAFVLHVLDSLALAQLGIEPQRALDLGTGNGFPGVAIRALWPAAELWLIDKTKKKLVAIDRICAAIGLEGLRTLQVDAAQVRGLHAELCSTFDLVTARAVGTPATVAELAAPFLCPGGYLALWLDRDQEAPESKAFTNARRIDYELPEPAARQRSLLVLERSSRS